MRGRYLPIVPIELKGEEWIELRAFVDSGASYSIFHADIAEILGIDHTKGEKSHMTTGDGARIPVYIRDVEVRFAEVEFTAKIGFSDKLGIGFDILGRKDFFERFTVCFSEVEKMIQFIK